MIKKVINLATFPIKTVLRLLWSFLSYFHLIHNDNATVMDVEPKDRYLRLQHKLKKFSTNPLPDFLKGTYTEAINAAKTTKKILLIYIHSDIHQDNEMFIRDVLTSNELLIFIKENDILFWAGDIQDEESYQVSNVLSVTQFPFLCLISLSRSQMRVIERFENGVQLDLIKLMARLQVLSQKIGNELRLLRQEQAEREHSRMIREQQDQAYKISLQKDQEKAKELEKEKEILKQKDQLKKEKLRRKENFKLDRKNLILELKRNQKSEPLLSNTTTKLSLRLPNGERIIRVFDLNDTLQDVLNYVLTLEFVELEWDYYLIRTFPKFEFNDLTLNLKDASLFPNGSLIVEKREFDELLDEELE